MPNTVFSFFLSLFVFLNSFTYEPATCKLFRDPIAFGLQSARAAQQDAAIAAATARVAEVADDDELASYAGLLGKRLYDEDDDVTAQIVSINTASSRGGKFEEIRVTCVELIYSNVPGCAISLTGKVSHAQRLTQLFCTLTHSHPALAQLTCILFLYFVSSHCCTG